MEIVPWPRVRPSQISILPNDPVDTLRNPLTGQVVQQSSRGASYWTGHLQWNGRLWDQDLDHDWALDDLTSFLDNLDGGINVFDIPLSLVLKGRPFRYPDPNDETTPARSRHVREVLPNTPNAPNVGLKGTIIMDVPPTQGFGLRRGDWISLHEGDDSTHYGAYRVRENQAVGSTVVQVKPKPPVVPGQYKMRMREPTLRARLTGSVPSVVYTGEWFASLTLQWESVT